MSWDQFWYELQSMVPAAETILSFVAIIALYFAIQRWAKVRPSVLTVVRDLAVVGVVWFLASSLLQLDTHDHWLRDTAAFVSNNV